METLDEGKMVTLGESGAQDDKADEDGGPEDMQENSNPASKVLISPARDVQY